MSKRRKQHRTPNKSQRQNTLAVLMAMCVIAGLGSVVIGAMSNDPQTAAGTIGGGLTASGIGLLKFYGKYPKIYKQ